jgi:hypothetical protein
MRCACSFVLLLVVLANAGAARGAEADMPPVPPLPALNDRRRRAAAGQVRVG